ncbi:MAG: hypothetical protein EOO06_15715 [Chitinophagaceae bacterium]|nr:MAG: hypothetical protein EOO06_15715 [Chitinophagaceae bacterium]
MNTNEPFCMITVGTQGSGKSHTVACVVESCLIPFPGLDIIRLMRPMNAVMFHYDDNINYVCEAIGLLTADPSIKHCYQSNKPGQLKRSDVTVLVSPMNYLSRMKFYNGKCAVKPLLFEWQSLSADHIKKIMGIDANGTQLYVATLLNILKSYQRHGAALPAFDVFADQVTEKCDIKGQDGPLRQRLNLLASMVKESEVNKECRHLSGDLRSCCMDAGSLVIVDLTDPLMSKQDANCIFQLLVEQYRAVPTTGTAAGQVFCSDC